MSGSLMSSSSSLEWCSGIVFALPKATLSSSTTELLEWFEYSLVELVSSSYSSIESLNSLVPLSGVTPIARVSKSVPSGV